MGGGAAKPAPATLSRNASQGRCGRRSARQATLQPWRPAARSTCRPKTGPYCSTALRSVNIPERSSFRPTVAQDGALGAHQNRCDGVKIGPDPIDIAPRLRLLNKSGHVDPWDADRIWSKSCQTQWAHPKLCPVGIWPNCGRNRWHWANACPNVPHLGPHRPICSGIARIGPEFGRMWADFGEAWCAFGHVAATTGRGTIITPKRLSIVEYLHAVPSAWIPPLGRVFYLQLCLPTSSLLVSVLAVLRFLMLSARLVPRTMPPLHAKASGLVPLRTMAVL